MSEKLTKYYELLAKNKRLKNALSEDDLPSVLRGKSKMLVINSYAIMDAIIESIEYISDSEREHIYDQCKNDIKIFNSLISQSINLEIMKSKFKM